MPASRLLFRSRRLVVDMKKPSPGAILVEDERIHSLPEYDAPAPDGAEIVDFGSLALMAGLVDFRSRGDAAAALAGGVTTVVEDEPGAKDAVLNVRLGSEDDLRSEMKAAAQFGRPVLVHADWNAAALELVARLCAETGCRTHAVRLSAAEALPVAAAAKRRGLPLTAGTCSQFLTFTAEDKRADGVESPQPPARPRANRELLWLGLRDGTLDMIASDDAPGAPELALPAAWTGFSARHGTLPSLSRLLSDAPARLAGLRRKGKLAPGFDADLVAWDPDASFVVKNKFTPYAGRALRGVVRSVIRRGRRVYDRATGAVS